MKILLPRIISCVGIIGVVIWSLYWFAYYIGQNINLFRFVYQFIDNWQAPFYRENFLLFPWGYLSFIFIILFLTTLLGSLFIAKCIPYLKLRYLFVQGLCLGMGVMAFLWEKAAIFNLLNPYMIIASFLIFLLIIIFMPSRGRDNMPLLKEESRWGGWEYFFFFLLVIVNGFILYWAVFYPVSYWDGLILYVRYARETFLMEGFPVRVTLQVGDGLGANYPHFFEVFSAGIAVLYGVWDDVVARVFPPLMGIATQVFIYLTGRLIFRSSRLALVATLLFRIVPYVVAYNIYASNYATAMAMTALFFYYITAFFKNGGWGYFLLAGLIAGFAAHLNYLMLILPAFFVFSALVYMWKNTTVRTCKILWITVGISLVIASTWYIRNFIVTGNPVYAFYHEIFGGKNINPEIEEFCFNEWQRNGDGIGNGMYGETLREKIGNSFIFWVSNPVTGWKVNPFLMVFFLPSLVVIFLKRRHLPSFIWLYLLFILALLFYHYCISGLYLYHIIIAFPVAALVATYIFTFGGKWLFRILAVLLALMAFFPAGIFSMYGFKLTGAAMYRGQYITSIDLLRMPVPENHEFWEMRYGPEGKMWSYINDTIAHRTILTHDNRYLCYNENIRIVHLDDWDVQQVYDMQTVEEKIGHLRSLGINYYLYIENEDNMINDDGEFLRDWVGLDKMIEMGYLEEKYRPADEGPILYRFRYVLDRNESG